MSAHHRSKQYISFLESIVQTSAFTRFSNLAAWRLPHILAEDEITRDAYTESMNRLREGWQALERSMSADQYQRIVLEVLLCRAVESFQHYLSQILARVFVERPETLRTSEQVTVREVLECVDMADFVAQRTEKKVNELAYRGLAQLFEHLNKELGLSFDTSSDLFRTVRELIEVRNIVVHNGGRVNAVFLERTQRNDLEKGALFPLTFEYVLDGFDSIPELAKAVDDAFTGHFGLSLNKPD